LKGCCVLRYHDDERNKTARFATQHQICKTKTKTDWSQTGIVLDRRSQTILLPPVRFALLLNAVRRRVKSERINHSFVVQAFTVRG